MSLGLQLLHGIIESQSRTFVRNLRPDLFVQDELPAYEFFRSFYRQYGGIPTVEIMRENGYALPPAGGPPAYLMDRIVNRAIFNSVREDVVPLQQALARQNGDALRSVLSGMHDRANGFINTRDVYLLPDAAEAAMEEYARVRDSGGELPGITLGWQGLNDLTGGAMPGEVVTWVARPNVGKSYTMAKVAIEANDQGMKVLLVSMEMGAVSIARRVIGMKAGINPDYIKRGTLSMWGEEIIFETIQSARTATPFVLVSGNLTKSVDVVDSLIQEHTPDVVLIDAQYLMLPSNARGLMKKFEILDKVGVEVQQMALARQVPVHQSVQYNREQGKSSKGDLRNIGGTDTVGQISSIVIGISEGPSPYESVQRVFEIIKNREGRLGEVKINFRFEPLDFSELPPEESEGEAEALDVTWMQS